MLSGYDTSIKAYRFNFKDNNYISFNPIKNLHPIGQRLLNSI
ncbi:Uncharacterised protein [Elizabethkingia meningoseptica]|nr:Uncharacterised protein [Elizabethkingia meningoseptica]